MVKLSIQCAIVGEVGSSFDVMVDDGEKVSQLKKEIIRQNDDINVPERSLHLSLAKTEIDAWLLEASHSAQKLERGEKPPEVKKMLAKNKMMPSWTIGEVLNEFGMTGTRAPSSKQVHVLVVILTAGVVSPRAVPKGPEVNLDCESLLKFLEGEMESKDATISSPHILEDDRLQFRLVGRENAIELAASCYRSIIAAHKTSASDRILHPIPVCSGVSGLGKTRMLEEGRNILCEVMKLDPKHITRVIVPYFNGYSPHPVERSMPIEVSFSWRLLYRVFLAKNCSLSFKSWFQSRLPCNGGELTLDCAMAVVAVKLRQKMEGPEPEPLYLFLGIDEYQKIDKVDARQKNPETSLVRELAEAVVDLMCSKPPNLVLLPMFAGTDLGVIASGSIANSSCFVTKRLPMNLLTVDQVFSLVESKAELAELLRNAQFCQNIFTLGGVPRWVVEYVLTVKNYCDQRNPDVPLATVVDKCFGEIWESYVKYYLTSFDIRRLVRLAALAVSGQTIEPDQSFDEISTWSRLRDSSLCLLVPEAAGASACNVRVPYALLHSIGSRHESFKIKVEKDFASALNDLKVLVDTSLFNVQHWQAWEMFGACFYAVRINALLLLGHSTVTLGKLLPGTLMTDKTRAISVRLVPTKVVKSADTFGASTPELISIKRSSDANVDWASRGCIVVNGDGGEGVDIFFALKDAATDQVIVVTDQRKRRLGRFQPSLAKKYLDKLSVCPDFLVEKGARMVRVVMNCVSASNLAKYEVPHDCILLSREGVEQLHGTLAYHPACSPVISINSACKTAIATAFRGRDSEVKQVVDEILGKRLSGGCSSDEVLSFIQSKQLKVELDDQVAKFTA